SGPSTTGGLLVTHRTLLPLVTSNSYSPPHGLSDTGGPMISQALGAGDRIAASRSVLPCGNPSCSPTGLPPGAGPRGEVTMPGLGGTRRSGVVRTARLPAQWQ